MYTYRAQVERIKDADTLECLVDLGFGTFRRDTFRLAGLNAPERNTAAGQEAKAFVEAWFMQHGREVVLQTVRDRQEKYGRYLATVTSPGGESLNGRLMEAKLAAPYPA